MNGPDFDINNLQNLKENPIKRLKYIVTGMVAGLHVPLSNCGDKAPIDPYLGETLYLYKQKSNTHFYIENI